MQKTMKYFLTLSCTASNVGVGPQDVVAAKSGFYIKVICKKKPAKAGYLESDSSDDFCAV
jgi:hypothetical protein